MSVFTIFNHGTASHRSRTDGEIIAEFGRKAKGAEYKDFLITDGPGATDAKNAAPHEKAPMAGTFDPYTRNKTEKNAKELQKSGFKVGFGVKHGLPGADPKFMSMNKPMQATGLITGKGWDDNVIHAMAAISELNPLPARINMIGWSRGAVTCAKMAFKLAELYPQVEINIFAIDPVAGLGNKADEDASALKSNVKNYVAILAMHEQRVTFKPQDIKRVAIDKSVNAAFLPFPGKHDTPVMQRSSPPETNQMVWSLGMRFLKNFGSEFTAAFVPAYTLQETCNLYGRMRVHMADYQAMRQHGLSMKAMAARAIGMGLKGRDFVTNKVDKYVVDADYFINEHHREAFRRAYPKVHMFLFEGRCLAGGEKGVWEEFKSMYNLTGLMESLAPFGVAKPNPGEPFVLPVMGSGHRRGSDTQLAQHINFANLGLF